MAFSIHVVVGVRLQRHVDQQSRSASAVDVRGAFKSGWSLMGLLFRQHIELSYSAA